MIDFIQDNLFAFIILFGLIAFFIVRDIVGYIWSLRQRKVMEKELEATEKEMKEVMKRLDRNKRYLTRSLFEIDKFVPSDDDILSDKNDADTDKESTT